MYNLRNSHAHFEEGKLERESGGGRLSPFDATYQEVFMTVAVTHISHRGGLNVHEMITYIPILI